MSLWTRILDGAADLLGAPFSALAERMRGGAGADATKSVAFTIGVIALSAKMAKADGKATAHEVAAFREVFRVDPGEEANVERIFRLAHRTTEGYETYARQIARLFRDNPVVLEQLLGALFHIAKADGKVPESEIVFLRTVARIFGFDDATFQRIQLSHLGLEACLGDPYCVIGVPRGAPEEELKAAYRRLVRENHPDSLIAQGLPAEAVALANERLAAINAAWETVRTERGIR